MPLPIAVNIISDDEDDDHHPNAAVSTPLPIPHSKKQRTESSSNPRASVVIIEDGPTPRKPVVGPTSSTPSYVADTPFSDFSKPYVPIGRCNKVIGGSDALLGSDASSSMPGPKSSGFSELICLESDNESESGFDGISGKQNKKGFAALEVAKNSELNSTCTDSSLLFVNAGITQMCRDSSWNPVSPEDDPRQVSDHTWEEAERLQPRGNISRMEAKNKGDADKERKVDEVMRKKRITKEERLRSMEEKKQQKEQEKLQKEALKVEAAEKKKQQKERQKLEKGWEKGKFAQNSIVAKIDAKVIELGMIGGPLLTRLAEKSLKYKITSNPVARSIVWTMSAPEDISQAFPGQMEILYVLLVYEAPEFCNLLTNESLMDHVTHVRCSYPSHTICYLTNRLMAYINKREQEQYKNPTNHSGWRRPPVEEMLSKLTTNFSGVHSRLCADEAELAEHVVGLTCSLASCQFRKKLTRLSVNANGSLLSKDCADRNLIKKSLWLKALVAIPKVQPRFAVAIWKKYPTMKSLLTVYMDSSKSVHEKEFLLKDLTTEGLVGGDRRLGEVCSKRVYRILMAQCGSIKTDDVENGADFFSCLSS